MTIKLNKHDYAILQIERIVFTLISLLWFRNVKDTIVPIVLQTFLTVKLSKEDLYGICSIPHAAQRCSKNALKKKLYDGLAK